ncbi:MAG TPA: molybdopterin-synthase adenylyltransferase MoeB, partial [Luteimonas sp.]|nr:molybdopterin-synthase adenylyltransferase MoeB [Luteimonas sp.]
MAITEVTPRDARHRLQQGARLIDVRGADERAGGMAEGAIGIDQDTLERDPAQYLPERGAEVLLICQSGARSALSAARLQRAGYAQVASVAGGTLRWSGEGLPMARPEGPIDHDFHARYARHLRLDGVGLQGQRRLEAARVLLVGAGGLGSPVAFYLAAAGVGHLRIVDDDVVDRSNLQRQILHVDADTGLAKVDSAETRLSALNPRVQVEPVAQRVTAANVDRLLADIDVVIDGADNFETRYLLNDACVRHRVPLVYGAVQRFEGQVSVFDAGRRAGIAPCYRCLFPEAPLPGDAPDCSTVGVLGVLPGVMGLLQANETIKLIIEQGEPLIGRLLLFEAL